jgi:hypothetical protein
MISLPGPGLIAVICLFTRTSWYIMKLPGAVPLIAVIAFLPLLKESDFYPWNGFKRI